MSRYLGRSFLFRAMAGLGAVLMAAAYAAYGALYVELSGWTGAGASLSSRVGGMVWFAVTLYALIAAFFILVLGLFATHRVAGPLYRLGMMLEEARGGRIPDGVQFREGDQILPLAEAQGRMFRFLAGRERELDAQVARVEEACRSLQEGAAEDPPDRWAGKVAKLRDALEGLSRASRR